MGMTCTFHCDCGFKTDTLFLGEGGQRGSTRRLVSCPTCRQLAAVKPGKAAPRCARCRQPVRGEDYGAPVPCPLCGKPLSMESTGIWD